LKIETNLEILFNYLRDALYNPASAVLDVEKLPEDVQEFAGGIQYFAECAIEAKAMAMALSRGELNNKPPSRGNEIAAPLKSLHASLKHLTWQAQQIAQGDYKQRVDFLGEFSDAFNSMVEQMAERQQSLEDKINQIQQGSLLLTALMGHVPLQIIVMDIDTHEILFMNDVVKNEVNNDADYIENIVEIISSRYGLGSKSEIEITYDKGHLERSFMINTYLLEWNNSNAEVFVINDISETKSKMEELELQAFQDSLTRLHNRTFGMLTFNDWLHDKKRFVLIFADLDNLKYINDEFGHNEGDIYIKNAAKHLKDGFLSNAMACRLGGDEFMLLVPDVDYDFAYETMNKIYANFQNDEYLKDKTYSYSISFGIVAVGSDNELPAGEILGMADEKMYENKRMRKKTQRKK